MLSCAIILVMLEAQKFFIVLAVFLSFLFVGGGIIYLWIANSDPTSPYSEPIEPLEPYVPGPPGGEVQAQLVNSSGFAALVSYTNTGFEPTELTVTEGDAVRFINNSVRELHLCNVFGDTSCRTLMPYEFGEFTFTQSGTWPFANDFVENHTGVVRVEEAL